MIRPESEASILKVPQTASVGEGCEDWNADKMGKSIPILRMESYLIFPITAGDLGTGPGFSLWIRENTS